jgi:hypothetical protein
METPVYNVIFIAINVLIRVKKIIAAKANKSVRGSAFLQALFLLLIKLV